MSLMNPAPGGVQPKSTAGRQAYLMRLYIMQAITVAFALFGAYYSQLAPASSKKQSMRSNVETVIVPAFLMVVSLLYILLGSMGRLRVLALYIFGFFNGMLMTAIVGHAKMDWRMLAAGYAMTFVAFVGLSLASIVLYNFQSSSVKNYFMHVTPGLLLVFVLVDLLVPLPARWHFWLVSSIFIMYVAYDSESALQAYDQGQADAVTASLQFYLDFAYLLPYVLIAGAKRGMRRKTKPNSGFF